MNTNNSAGKKLATGIGVYVLGKTILNAVLGGFSLSDLLIAVGEFLLLLCGLRYTNYVIAAILAIVALVHLPANVSNIGSNWIYLLEGIADILCAVTLCTNSDLKEHFTNDLSDIKK